MADVDVAVRVRRAVVQNEARATLRGRANRLVDLALLPIANPARFPARQIAAHRKRGVGEIERGLVVGFGIVGHEDVLFFAFTAAHKNSRACATSARICSVSASMSSYFSSSRSLCRNSTVTRSPIDRLVEIEHEHFEQGLSVLLHRRPHAEAGHAGARRRSRARARARRRCRSAPDAGAARCSRLESQDCGRALSPCATRPDNEYGRPRRAAARVRSPAASALASRSRMRVRLETRSYACLRR